MKKAVLFLCVASSCTAAALALVAQLPSQAALVSHPLTLPAADALDIGGCTDVIITEGSPQQVAVAGPAYLLDHSELAVRGGVLRFRPAAGVWQGVGRWSAQRVTLRLTLPALRRVTLAGASTLTGLTPLTAPRLAVVLAGAGQATLALRNSQTDVWLQGAGTVALRGTTTAQAVHLAGAGTYHGFGLHIRRAAATITGVGTGELWATDSLNVCIRGIGTIHYRGRPGNISQEISGLGALKESE